MKRRIALTPGIAHRTLHFLSRCAQFCLLLLVGIYRYTLSPALHLLAPGSGCRFEPSCSNYAALAIHRHGPWRGLILTLKRLSRCHPWGDCGIDPVPETCTCTAQSDPQHPTKPDSKIASL